MAVILPRKPPMMLPNALVQSITKRPAMYVIPATYYNVCGFLVGYDMAAQACGAKGYEEGVLRKFSNFIADKYGRACVWIGVLADEFRDLSDEHLLKKLAEEFQEFTDAQGN